MTLLDALEAPLAEGTAHRYNDDLLLHLTSREHARREFPRLFHVLDDDGIRSAFEPVDRAANEAKRGSQRSGLTAIALGVVSLLGAGTEPIWRTLPEPWPTVIAIAAAAAGVAAFLVGALGVLLGARKRRWLYNRLQTERLRQFHFQSLIWDLPAIAASCETDAAAQAFVNARRKAVAAFSDRLAGHLDSELHDLLEADGGDRLWLYENGSDHVPAVPTGFDVDELFRAYRRLRLEEQRNHAAHKLADFPGTGIGFLNAPLRRQHRLLRGTWLVCFTLLIAAHGALMAGHLAHWGFVHSPATHVAIVVLALLALGVRTTEEALGLRHEIERYEDYHAAISDALRRFDDRRDPAGKLRVMIDVERVSFEEMRSFVRSAKSSSFVL